MRDYLIIFICLFSLFSCDKPKTPKLKTLAFQKPIIKQLDITDSAKYLPSDSLYPFDPIFAGKYKFGDSLFVVDDERAYRFRGNISEDRIHDEEIYLNDTLQTDGFELITDYSSTIIYRGFKYFSLYIINRTPDDKVFISKDGHAFGIQEAKTRNGYWFPIEAHPSDFCGNGYSGFKIRQGEFVALFFPKYDGGFETELRIRLQVGNNLYVTKSFPGKINKSQFFLKKVSQNTYLGYGEIRSAFYGTYPLQVYDKSMVDYVLKGK